MREHTTERASLGRHDVEDKNRVWSSCLLGSLAAALLACLMASGTSLEAISDLWYSDQNGCS
jgi:hypothetical protein